MTKAYVLMAMKPQIDDSKTSDEESSDDENPHPTPKTSNGKATNGHAVNIGGFERTISLSQGHESEKPCHPENDHLTSTPDNQDQEDIVTNGLRQRVCNVKNEEGGAGKRDFVPQVEPL